MANPSDLSDITNYKIAPKTIEILKTNGITSLFPIQYRTFNFIYEGHDLIGRDRTGSGKTLGYALPVIERYRAEGYFNQNQRGRRPISMTVCPTRELAIQVRREYLKLAHYKGEYQVLAVYGGTPIYDQIRELQQGVDFIVGTPGRIIDLSNKKKLQYGNMRAFCLDEADEMLNMGFQEDIDEIFKYITDQ